MAKKPHNQKQTNSVVTEEFLKEREGKAASQGFAPPKWIGFCRKMMAAGFACSLYEARRTVSKYITVSSGGKSFKVRFSNHRPIKARENAGDCDFFVGVCNTQTTTTEQAITATMKFLSEGVKA